MCFSLTAEVAVSNTLPGDICNSFVPITFAVRKFPLYSDRRLLDAHLLLYSLLVDASAAGENTQWRLTMVV